MKKIRDIISQCLWHGFALYAFFSSLLAQSANLDSFQAIQLMKNEDCAVVQVNASWNWKNRLPIEHLRNCYKAEIDLANKSIGAVIQKEWQIKVVPTIIIFKNGEMIAKLEPGISMKFDEEDIFRQIEKEIR